MVLICHPHKFIYVKPTKTAGTSIEMYFEPACVPPGQEILQGRLAQHSSYGIVGARDGNGRLYRQVEKTIWQGHMNARDIAAACPDEWQSYFKFTSIRNPFDRAYSGFMYMVSTQILNSDITLQQAQGAFLRYLRTTYREKFSEYERLHIDGDFPYDDVIRFEALHEGLQRISSRFGLDPAIHKLPHTRNTAQVRKQYPIEEIFQPQHVDIIMDVDGWVFDRFGYDTTPPHEKTIAPPNHQEFT